MRNEKLRVNNFCCRFRVLCGNAYKFNPMEQKEVFTTYAMLRRFKNGEDI